MTATEAPWAGLRVVEVATGPAGAFAARMLAGLGAEVVRLESARPDPLRRAGVAIGGASTAFAAYGLGKIHTRFDAGDGDDRAHVERLLAGADVVVESVSDEERRALGMEPEAVQSRHPHLVHATVTPFGSHGPYRDWSADDLALAALSGWMGVQGEEGRPPLSPGLDVFAAISGNVAALAISAALVARDRDGRGQHVEVRGFEVAVATQIFDTVAYSYTGRIRPRRANAPGEPWSILAAADGEVACAASAMRAWDDLWLPLCGYDALPEGALDPDRTPDQVRDRAALAEIIAQWRKRDLTEGAQTLRHLVGEVLSVRDALESPQHAARDYFDTAEIAGIPVRVPGAPVRFDAGGWVPAGVQELEPIALARVAERWPPVRRELSDPVDAPPLAGVRVVDFTAGWAGPYATQLLADLGADVVKIESVSRADWWRTSRRMFTRGLDDPDWLWEMSPLFNPVNESKRGITLDMNDPRGRALVHALVSRADIVIDNYTPRVMGFFGLSFPDIQKLNPLAVAVSMPGFGSTGPWASYKSTALVAEAMAGVTSRCGYADSASQVIQMSPADPNAGVVAAWATVAAVRRARARGRGERVEVAQVEALTHLLTAEMIEVQVTGAEPPRRVNTTPGAALSGCWPACGDDQWIVVSAADEEALVRLADVVQGPPGDVKAVAAYLAAHDKHEAACALQAVGVTAAPVQIASEVLTDPHLRASGFFHRLDREFVGEHDYPSTPFRLSRSAVVPRRPAPLLGADTREVLAEWLGADEAEYEALLAAGVTGTQPAGTHEGKVLTA